MKPKYWSIIILAALAASAGAVYYVKQPAQDLGPVVVHHVVKTALPTVDELKDWKTYTNTEYGFEFKYPPTITASSVSKNVNEIYFGGVNDSQEDFPYSLQINIKELKPSEECIAKKIAEKNIKETDTLRISISEPINVNDSRIDVWQVESRDAIAVRSDYMDTFFVNKNCSVLTKKFYVHVWQNRPSDLINYNQILSTFKFTSPQAQIDTSGWKTYTNSQYGFEFKYPPNQDIIEETNSGIVTVGNKAFKVAPVILGKKVFNFNTNGICKINIISFAGQSAKVCEYQNDLAGYGKFIKILDLPANWDTSNEISVTTDNGEQEQFLKILSTFKFIK